MKPMFRKVTIGGLLAVCALALAVAGVAPNGAYAQADYPGHPVRVIVPFAAGGVADITLRLVAQKLGDKLGQNFVIENNPGAGGIAAARAALAGGADGYTLMLQTNGTAISVPLFNHLSFDPVKDFKPISLIGSFDTVFVIDASSSEQTLKDFLNVALQIQPGRPGALNIGAVNVGSTQYLTAQLFRWMTDLYAEIVAFRATPDMINALLRGDVQMGIDFYAALKPSLDSGKVRAIATSGSTRSPALPDVPTVRESGILPGFEVVAWSGLYAPAGTPDAVIDKLNSGLQDVLADPDLKKRALALGVQTQASTPAELDARMRDDIAKWDKVIAQANIPKHGHPH